MALTCGTKLGPYEVQLLLGAGGMGEVYRARDTRLERMVAIRILPVRSEEHTSELQLQSNIVCRLLLETKNPSFWSTARTRRPGALPAPSQGRSTKLGASSTRWGSSLLATTPAKPRPMTPRGQCSRLFA